MGMGACEVMVKEGDYSEGLFCVVVVQDRGLSVLEEAFCRADTKFYSRRSSILWYLSLCGRGLWIVSYVIWRMLHAENHQHQ